jgi:hypothetical protein
MVGEQRRKAHPVLIDDIDNNDELAVILAVVDKSHSPNLDVPLERLHMKKKNTK